MLQILQSSISHLELQHLGDAVGSSSATRHILKGSHVMDTVALTSNVFVTLLVVFNLLISVDRICQQAIIDKC